MTGCRESACHGMDDMHMTCMSLHGYISNTNTPQTQASCRERGRSGSGTGGLGGGGGGGETELSLQRSRIRAQITQLKRELLKVRSFVGTSTCLVITLCPWVLAELVSWG